MVILKFEILQGNVAT